MITTYIEMIEDEYGDLADIRYYCNDCSIDKLVSANLLEKFTEIEAKSGEGCLFCDVCAVELYHDRTHTEFNCNGFEQCEYVGDSCTYSVFGHF